MQTSRYTVRIAHRANRDINGGYWGQRPTARAKWVAANSLAEASALCMAFMDQWELGGGNWSGGQIRNADGVEIAQVSFNGRVWDMNCVEIEEAAQ